MIIINKLISAVLQVLLFSLIPFIVYLVMRRKNKEISFFEFIGLKRANNGWIKQSTLFTIIALALASFPLIFLYLTNSMESDLLSYNNFVYTSLGVGLFLELIIYSFIQTALSEEIFFRGFIGKQLIIKLGYNKGNIIQALIFGSFHCLPFIQYGTAAIIVSILMPAALGYPMGYINEKKNNGSILPSYLMHSMSNFISMLLLIIIFRYKTC